MNDALLLTLAGMAGAWLGAFFYGGLWWTARKGLSSPRPALWFLGSGLVRMSVALAGFYFVGGGQWPRFAACLVGFVLARVVVMRLTRPPAKRDFSPTREVRHAP